MEPERRGRQRQEPFRAGRIFPESKGGERHGRIRMARTPCPSLSAANGQAPASHVGTRWGPELMSGGTYTARLMVVAFLESSAGLLLMRRSPGARLLPGMWAGIGGHVEPDESSAPACAMVREIAEETTLGPQELLNLRLTAIVLRLRGREVRQQYVYWGQAPVRDMPETREGRPAWVPWTEVPTLAMSASTRFILERQASGLFTDALQVGVLTDGGDGEPRVAWNDLADWESS